MVLVLFALPAAAQKVYVDYDRKAIKNDYKSFAWGPTPETSLGGESPLMHSRIKNTVEYYLTEGGLIEDTKDPDLYVTYHTNSSEEVRYNTTTFGYSYGSAWGYNPYWGGMGGGTTSTTTAQSYQRGSLIIDIWDARTKEIVWRGTAEATVTSNPEKGAKKIDKALKKMIKQYQKLRAEDAK